jgi:hypothetical protein
MEQLGRAPPGAYEIRSFGETPTLAKRGAEQPLNYGCLFDDLSFETRFAHNVCSHLKRKHE